MLGLIRHKKQIDCVKKNRVQIPPIKKFHKLWFQPNIEILIGTFYPQISQIIVGFESLLFCTLYYYIQHPSQKDASELEPIQITFIFLASS